MDSIFNDWLKEHDAVGMVLASLEYRIDNVAITVPKSIWVEIHRQHWESSNSTGRRNAGNCRPTCGVSNGTRWASRT